jgi:penicillin-binding protein 1A
VLNPATAYVMTDMMRSVVESGTAKEAKRLGRPAAGKTGTTNESMDAWFVGFTPDLVVGVWVGSTPSARSRPFTGGRASTPIWTRFMERALEGRPVRDFTAPPDVTLVKVDTQTGLLAVAGRATRVEPFVVGTEPTHKAPTPTLPEPEVVAIPGVEDGEVPDDAGADAQ